MAWTATDVGLGIAHRVTWGSGTHQRDGTSDDSAKVASHGGTGANDSAGGRLLFRIGQRGGDPDSDRDTADGFIPYRETDSPGDSIG